MPTKPKEKRRKHRTVVAALQLSQDVNLRFMAADEAERFNRIPGFNGKMANPFVDEEDRRSR